MGWRPTEDYIIHLGQTHESSPTIGAGKLFFGDQRTVVFFITLLTGIDSCVELFLSHEIPPELGIL